MNPLRLGAATQGYLYQTTLEDSLRRLAVLGFQEVELTAVPPHIYPPGFGYFERRQLRRLLNGLGMHLTAVNPNTIDLNLISTNLELREVTFRQFVQNLELAHDLESPIVVVIPGRLNALYPAPDADVAPLLRKQLAQLLRHAERLGVIVALENAPYGFMQTAPEMCAVVEAVNHPLLKITYDCANALMNEDPVAGLTRIGRHLALAHISDTWRKKWAHTSIGRGDMDFGAFAGGLRAIGFSGVTVYELVDGEDPDPRLRTNLPALNGWGWVCR